MCCAAGGCCAGVRVRALACVHRDAGACGCFHAGPDIGVAVTKRAGRASSHTQTVRLPPLELLVLVLGLALTLHVRVVALSL